MSADPDLGADPIATLVLWLDAATASGATLPEAMALATATADGKPSVRMVLYKGVKNGGVAFFTNYESRKARELDANPNAALVFHWVTLTRQVRLEGRVERLTAAESDAYFRTRDRDSQLGAWTSPQSREIGSRSELEERRDELERDHAGHEVPRPPFWGGYRLVPDVVEFWLGRAHRLHDRVEYRRDGAGWRIRRLAP